MLVVITALSIFFFDYWIKSYALAHLDYNIPVEIIPHIVWLRLVKNTGAAFGMLPDKPLLLAGIGAIFLFVIIGWLYRHSHVLSDKIACALIIGGALSNLYDRIVRGFVVDYVDLGWWPVFNLSDSVICIGCGILIIRSFMEKGKCNG